MYTITFPEKYSLDVCSAYNTFTKHHVTWHTRPKMCNSKSLNIIENTGISPTKSHLWTWWMFGFIRQQGNYI